MAVSQNTKSVISNRHTNRLGPNVGFQDSFGASWEYFDLSDYVGREVRIYVKTASMLGCFVASDSVTPATSNSTTADEDHSFSMFAGTVEYYVVPDNCPVFAYRQDSGAGVVMLHIV